MFHAADATSQNLSLHKNNGTEERPLHTRESQ
jgi:hypothetical protein